MSRRTPSAGSFAAWQQVAIAQQRMWMAAGEVIFRRSLDMMAGTMTATEATKMVMEKPIAFSIAAQQAALATVSGKSGAAVLSAATKPIQRKATSNASRLRRRKT